jgi:hypothetical protein
VGAAFCLGFLGHQYLFNTAVETLPVGLSNVIKMSLGLGFCHAFMVVYGRSHRANLTEGWKLAARLWRNLTMSYAMFLTILFLTNGIGIVGGRAVVGTGYALGFVFLCAGRFIAVPRLSTGTGREGRKNIVIAEFSRDTSEEWRRDHPEPVTDESTGSRVSTQAPRGGRGSCVRLVDSRDDIDKVLMDDGVEELHISCDVLSADDIAGLLDRAGNRKIKIVLRSDRVEARERSGIGTAAT